MCVRRWGYGEGSQAWSLHWLFREESAEHPLHTLFGSKPTSFTDQCQLASLPYLAGFLRPRFYFVLSVCQKASLRLGAPNRCVMRTTRPLNFNEGAENGETDKVAAIPIVTTGPQG